MKACDTGPPDYRKPHDLKKLWKVAVLVAVIKNLESDFEKIRRLVCKSQTVQNKMSHKENRIWVAVIRGEEMKMKSRLQMTDLVIGDLKALSNLSTGSNIGGIVAKRSDVCLVPSSPSIKAESRGVADKEFESLPSSLMKGEMSKTNKFKRIAIAEPEMIPIRSPTFSQGPILETIRTATSEGETNRRQKLKGIAIADIGISKSPNYQNDFCRGSSIFSHGSMNTNKMLHPSAMNYCLCNDTLCPSSTDFSMPCAKPGCFRVPTSLGSNNDQVNYSNFGGQVSNNIPVTSFNFGGQISNCQTNSFKFSGQSPDNNQVDSFNFGGRMSNNNQVNSSSSVGQIPSANQVNFSNYGGQISNYLNSTADGMSMGSLNVPSIPQGSKSARPINDQVVSAEGQDMQGISAADSMMQDFELEDMDFDFTPFADAETSDFNFDLDSFTGGEDPTMMQQPNGSKFDWNL